ncbi:MAG: hypothetical protein ACYTHK_06435 [Planctomycetota bacterium]|jgi:hypothetical protein
MKWIAAGIVLAAACASTENPWDDPDDDRWRTGSAGRILEVLPDAGGSRQVRISVGAADGFEQGEYIRIVRGSKYIGTARAWRIEKETALAVMLPDDEGATEPKANDRCVVRVRLPDAPEDVFSVNTHPDGRIVVQVGRWYGAERGQELRIVRGNRFVGFAKVSVVDEHAVYATIETEHAGAAAPPREGDRCFLPHTH